jgi:hypothetical protein
VVRTIAAVLIWLVSASVLYAQQPRTLAWDPSPDAGRVTEYHVYKDGLYHGATTGLTYTLTFLPGEAADLFVRSYGWLLDPLTGLLTNVAGEGSNSAVYRHSEPAFPPAPAPVTSPNGTTCQVNTNCQIIDAQLARWTIEAASRAILKDTFHWNGGYGDWLLWFDGAIYAFNASYPDAGGSWWKDASTQWVRVAGDPRVAAPPPPPTPTGCLTGGTLAPIGSLLTQTMRNGDVDAFVAARVAEGWALRSRAKVKNQTTVTMECRGL